MYGVGKKIKIRRYLLGYSANFVSSQIGMDLRYYRRIEKDEVNITISKLRAIARVLGIGTDSLISCEKSLALSINYHKIHYERALDIFFKRMFRGFRVIVNNVCIHEISMPHELVSELKTLLGTVMKVEDLLVEVGSAPYFHSSGCQFICENILVLNMSRPYHFFGYGYDVKFDKGVSIVYLCDNP